MPKRVDAQQSIIVAALRQFGASVVDTHIVGKGCPDIFVGFRWKIFAMEIKSPGAKLTQAEARWLEHWKGNYYIIHNFEEAIEIITEGE